MNDERGVSSVQFLLASALGLVMFVGMANLVVVQYGRGVIRSALEQGARAGSLTGDAAACLDKSEEVVGQLLAGRMSDTLELTCTVSANTMIAAGSAVFASWTPMTPDFSVELTSEATIEPDP